ncbi:MAG: tetratricopeptide repeat protein [Acidimicrobiia bacterium]|nr:tetratricopeptide repeat protein [Acidimicrobiia bacterium]
MKVGKLWLYAFVALLLNSAYLWPLAEPSLLYLGNLVAHMVLGLVLAAACLAYVLRHFKSMPLAMRVGLVLFLLSALPGMALMKVGAMQPTRWLLHIHIAMAIPAAVVLGVAFRAFSRRAGLGIDRDTSRLAWRTYLVAVPMLAVFPAGVKTYQHYFPSGADRIQNPTTAPASMYEEGPGQDSPFFPSSANTTSGRTIPSNFFMTSETCKRCHADIYEQWNSSMHHFSSFNNQWYRKSIEYMQDVVGTKPSKWCAGCHDHAVFFNGRFDTPIKEQINTPEAQAGLACTSCHSIVKVNDSMGNGGFVIEYPALHDLAASKNRFLQWAHDFLVEVDPEPHKKIFMKPFHRQDVAEMCSTCHKVHLDVPVNAYRWMRGFNDYDNWQASGVSGQGARSFYYPKQSQKCVDCHMPLVDSNDLGNVNGKVHSHRFPAANTAVPLANQDHKQLQTVIDFLRNKHVTVDIFALSVGQPAGETTEPVAKPPETLQLSSSFAVGEESESFGAGSVASTAPAAQIVAPLDKVPAAVRRGDSVRVDVVVRTRTVGHFFPGGTVDAFDVWLELQAIDRKGQTVFWSGRVEDNGKGPVEPGAHMYRSYLLDERGNHINKRNAWAARSVLYVRLIPPGAADTAHFRLHIPETAGDRITLKAKLNYRKFSWWNTQWAYAGIRDLQQGSFGLDKGYDDGRWIFKGDLSQVSGKLKEIPDVPIVAMAEDEKQLLVVDRNGAMPDQRPKYEKDDLLRWNDYGIGLLLQGDLKGAEAAFLGVTEIDPSYVDGWVNVGRSRLQEGNTAGAQQVLRKALDLDGELAKSNYFYALSLKTQGKYDEALLHLRKALAKYPRDRVVRNQAGRLLFLKRQYAEAIREFEETLKVDPEDLQAHYNLMLCHQGLGNTEQADREQKLYLRFKADESAQAITGPVRLRHPQANNERQPIHEHVSVPLGNPADTRPTKSTSRTYAAVEP